MLGELVTDKQSLTDRLVQTQPPAAVLLEETEIGELQKLVGADLKLRQEALKAGTFSIDERGKCATSFAN